MLDTLNNLVASKKIPALDEVQMSALLHYTFTDASRPLRIAVAEAVYRYDHHHPNAFDLFLACTLPMAEKAAKRKAERLFFYPSDWQIELMYDGAVTAMIAMFQRNTPLRPEPDAFRRYLLRALALGTVRSYFMRQENETVRPVDNLGLLCGGRKTTIDSDVITRELLEQVLTFPHLPDDVRATLHAIATLGPDIALKEHAYTPWPVKKRLNGTPILNPDAIANAVGIPRRIVHRHLFHARTILRDVFNRDGKLFLTH